MICFVTLTERVEKALEQVSDNQRAKLQTLYQVRCDFEQPPSFSPCVSVFVGMC